MVEAPPLPNPGCATEKAYEVLPPPKFWAGYATACDHSGLLFRIDIAGPKPVPKTSFPVPQFKKACYETLFQPSCH